MYDLIIVGGGPAGLTAAIYAIRRRLDVLLVSPDLGGKTNQHLALPGIGVHQVIRGGEVIEKFRRELAYIDFAHRLESVTAISQTADGFTVEIGQQRLTAKTVILATGAQVKKLGVPGEQDYLGKGLSYSATSYAHLFSGKRAVVIGDGPLALNAATELAQLAEAVHWIAPTPEILPPLPVETMKMVRLAGHRVKAIRGHEFVEGIILQTPDGREVELETDGVFVELGLIPNSTLVKDMADLDGQGRVKIDNRTRTSCPGLFAAGDVTDAFTEQVLIAVGEGAKAALSAYEYLLTKP